MRAWPPPGVRRADEQRVLALERHAQRVEQARSRGVYSCRNSKRSSPVVRRELRREPRPAGPRSKRLDRLIGNRIVEEAEASVGWR